MAVKSDIPQTVLVACRRVCAEGDYKYLQSVGVTVLLALHDLPWSHYAAQTRYMSHEDAFNRMKVEIHNEMARRWLQMARKAAK